MIKYVQIQDKIIETPVSKKVVSYSHLSLTRDREVYDAVIEESKRYGGINNITPFWEFEKGKGYRGSNLGLSVLVSQVLRDKERIPTVTEALALDKAEFLTTRFFVDYGAVFYSAQKPNQDIGETLVKQLKKLRAPVILHPADLQLKDDGRIFTLKKDARYIIAGKEAQDILARLDWVGNSGARRLYRDRDGNWSAYSKNLSDS